MGKQLLVVGGGTGGLMVANHMARHFSREIQGGEIGITVLDQRDEYIYQPGFLYVAFNLMRPDELRRKIRDLISPGITFIQDKAVKIDAAARRVATATHGELPYDYLVLATGSYLNLQEIPGLAESAHWFYTLDGAIKLRDALLRFAGGRVVVTVGLPHKCPVAPLEFTLMLDDWTRRRGIRDRTEIIYTFPINGAHSIKPLSEWAIREFAERGITLETFFNMEAVDPAKREISSLEGTTFAYDLLVAVPPHIGDNLGKDSGLAEAGNWLPTNRSTLQLLEQPDIWVVGDATNLPVSKAGSVAHYEAEVVAENLIDLVTGQVPSKLYTGKAFCFVEAGLSKATAIEFDYNNPPRVPPPSQAIHWFKQAYNRIHWLNLKSIV